MNLLRIGLQFAYGLLLAGYFLLILVGQGDCRVIPWMLWPLCALVGGVLAFIEAPLGNRLLLWFSSLTFGFGAFLQIARVYFLVEHGGMEGPDGRGSPIAFIMGWIASAIVIFLPGAVFLTWNLIQRKASSKVVVGTILLPALAGVVGCWLTFSESSPSVRASALNATREWARLVELPEAAEDVRIQTLGSMFTREFRVTFSAPPEVIQQWLRDSPGTRECVPEVEANGSLRYEITPGGGAQFAELVLSPDKRKVLIRAFWS